MIRRFALPLLLTASPALAHGGEAHGAIGWSWEPGVVIPLAIALGWYAIGLVRLLARADAGRPNLWRGARRYFGGWLVLALAMVSPLHEGGERSFALHMTEHELIMLVAALLIAASRPVATMLWALPRPARQALAGAGRSGWIARPWRALTDPVTATILQAIALWAWHAPALFDRALDSPAWHIAQHLSFLVTALLFWWSMLETRATGLAALCLFVTSVVGGALGALMALSASPWYADYAAMGMTPIGLTPEEDQQLAGLIMWVPGGMVHAGAALLLLARYLAQGEKRRAVAAE